MPCPHETMLRELGEVALKIIRFEWGADVDHLSEIDPRHFDSDKQRHYWFRLEALAKQATHRVGTAEGEK